MSNKKINNELIYLEIEKSRIQREKSKLVLDKSLILYFLFMLVGIIGFVFNYIDSFMLNVLIIVGIIILGIGTIPYLLTISREEKKIRGFITDLRK
jgi:Flp pilus assembly protein TadB